MIRTTIGTAMTKPMVCASSPLAPQPQREKRQLDPPKKKYAAIEQP